MTKKIAIVSDRGNTPMPSKGLPLYIKKNLDLIPKKFRKTIGDDPAIRVSMYVYLYLLHHNKNLDIDLYTPNEFVKLPLSKLKTYNYIFNFFEILELLRCDFTRDKKDKKSKKMCIDDYRNFISKLSKSGAKIYPNPKMYRFVINKANYYRHLQKAAIPTAPLLSRNIDTILDDFPGFIDLLMSKRWKGLIIKPSYFYGSGGILVIKDKHQKGVPAKIKAHIKDLKKHDAPNIVVQEFLPSFGENFEIRTFWNQGKYVGGTGTRTPPLDEGRPEDQVITEYDTFRSEGGHISNELKKKLIRMGKKVMRTLPVKPSETIITRIDFGCCIDKNKYFVNEIELIMAAGNYLGPKLIREIGKTVSKIVR